MTLRFFNRRALFTALAIVALVCVSLFGGLFVYINSAGFKDRIRQSLVREIEARTGTSAALGKVRWNLREQRIFLEDITLRGLEPADGPPLARIESITAGVNFRSLLQRRLNLFQLTITRPRFRLLIDSSGKTNFPSPSPADETGKLDYQ